MGKYQPYQAYGDSGVLSFGKIPTHWAAKPLKILSTYNDEVLSESTDPDVVIEYVDISSVSATDGIKETTTVNFAAAPSRARRIARDGDVLVSTVRTYLEAIAWVENPPDNMIASTGFAVVRANPSLLNRRYAGYALRARYFIDEVVSRSVGVSYPAINASDLVSIKVPVPALEEQATIAAFLDHETAKIDRLIARQERLIELLKEKRQAVISHAVTKGLNPDAPMKDSGVEWLGEVPAHWEVARLKHVATLQSGVAKGRDLAGKDTIRVPYLRVANVQDGYLALDDVAEIEIQQSELTRYLLRDGDVLMNEGGDNDKLGRGTVWRCEVEPCIHQNHVFAIRPQRVEPEWLTLVTQTSYAKFYFFSVAKQSTNLASISSTNIKETPLVIPPADERREIRRFVEAELERYDRLMSLAERQIGLLTEHRTALVSAAVTGKIDVRDFKPSDI